MNIEEWGERNHVPATDSETQQAQTMSVMAAAATTATDPKDYLCVPFGEEARLNSGGLRYSATDFALPGKNGFDFVISRQYDSGSANTQDIAPSYTNKKLHINLIRSEKLEFKQNIGGTKIPYSFDGYIWASTPCESQTEANENAKWKYNEYNVNFGANHGNNINDPAKAPFHYQDYIDGNGEEKTLAKESLYLTRLGRFYNSDYTYTQQDVFTTGSRPNTHFLNTYGLGYGWRFMLPSIENVSEAEPDNKVSCRTFLHLGDGRTLQIKGSALYTDDTAKYQLKDVAYQSTSGTLTHPERPSTSKSYNAVVTYKNGNRDFFQSNKLVARQDRFGNCIFYTMSNGGGMTIVDSWGRDVVLAKSGEL